MAGTARSAFAAPASAPVKIGVLGDRSSIYSDIGGIGSVEAVHMAIEDSGAIPGGPVQVVSADHQNKADIGSAIARRWYDEEGVDLITDLPNSAVALAVIDVARDRHRLAFTSAGSSDITGPHCSPFSAQWVYDTYALGKSLGTSVVKQGGDSWFFITVDYVFGHTLERDTARFVKEAGGKVLGSVRAPINTQDFSAFLLQAQVSKAKVIGFANTGRDTANSVKQAREFGIGPSSGQILVGLNAYVSDVNTMGLQVAQGLRLAEPFYWDLNDVTRAWSRRFEKRVGRKPTAIQAGAYSGVFHYLRAVKALGGKDAAQVMAKMRDIPINDAMTTNGKLRIDGRVVRDMYLFEVKRPDESKYPYDFYKLTGRVPGDEATRPLHEGGCSLAA